MSTDELTGQSMGSIIMKIQQSVSMETGTFYVSSSKSNEIENPCIHLFYKPLGQI